MAAFLDDANLGPLVGALADLTVSVARIAAMPATAWAAVGPIAWVVPDPAKHLTCALCGQPIMDLPRAADDGSGRVAHYDQAECLTTIRDIMNLALDTYIPPMAGVEDLDAIPF